MAWRADRLRCCRNGCWCGRLARDPYRQRSAGSFRMCPHLDLHGLLADFGQNGRGVGASCHAVATPSSAWQYPEDLPHARIRMGSCWLLDKRTAKRWITAARGARPLQHHRNRNPIKCGSNGCGKGLPPADLYGRTCCRRTSVDIAERRGAAAAHCRMVRRAGGACAARVEPSPDSVGRKDGPRRIRGDHRSDGTEKGSGGTSAGDRVLS